MPATTAKTAPARARAAGKPKPGKRGAPARKRPPATPPPAPRLTKRELTLAEAAEQWERTDAALAKLAERSKPLEAARGEAEEVLLAHFEQTGSAAYEDRIGWHWTSTRLILDQDKVAKFLGDQLAKFQRRTQSKRKLARLKQ